MNFFLQHLLLVFKLKTNETFNFIKTEEIKYMIVFLTFLNLNLKIFILLIKTNTKLNNNKFY